LARQPDAVGGCASTGAKRTEEFAVFEKVIAEFEALTRRLHALSDLIESATEHSIALSPT
jgi:hypothetical protein